MGPKRSSRIPAAAFLSQASARLEALEVRGAAHRALERPPASSPTSAATGRQASSRALELGPCRVAQADDRLAQRPARRLHVARPAPRGRRSSRPGPRPRGRRPARAGPAPPRPPAGGPRPSGPPGLPSAAGRLRPARGAASASRAAFPEACHRGPLLLAPGLSRARLACRRRGSRRRRGRRGRRGRGRGGWPRPGSGRRPCPGRCGGPRAAARISAAASATRAGSGGSRLAIARSTSASAGPVPGSARVGEDRLHRPEVPFLALDGRRHPPRPFVVDRRAAVRAGGPAPRSRPSGPSRATGAPPGARPGPGRGPRARGWRTGRRRASKVLRRGESPARCRTGTGDGCAGRASIRGSRGRPSAVPGSSTATSATSKAAPSSQRRETTQGRGSPSTRKLARSEAAGWWRFRQPSRQTAARSFQRRLSPVRSTSRASAKLDLPEPLRPTTRVRPGPGASSRVCARPMPRNPSTVTECRKTPAGVGEACAASGCGEAALPASCASRTSRPPSAPRTRAPHALADGAVRLEPGQHDVAEAGIHGP